MGFVQTEGQAVLKNELLQAKMRITELSREAEQLKDFIENVSVSLHWVNGSGIIIWANQAELNMLGYAKSEYLGRHISNFHADKPVIEDILQRLMNKETLRNYPARLKCKNGDVKHVVINSSVFWKNDEFINTRCYTRDISEYKKAEQEKADLILELEERNKRLLTEIEMLKKLRLAS